MNSIRLAVGVLSVFLATEPCPLAVAQVSEHSAALSFGRTNSRESEAPTAASQRDYSVAGLLEEPATPVLDDCCGPTCRDAGPATYGQVEALLLWRDSRLIDQPIVVDANTGAAFMATSDLDGDFAPGVRATIGRRVSANWALEFSYFGIFEGDASAQAVSPDPGALLIFPDNFFGNVFAGMDLVQANYDSTLNSFEVNLASSGGCGDQCCSECDFDRASAPSYEWFTGFRYINVDEGLNILAERTVAGALEVGSYEIRTDNNLYGLQFGGRTRRMRGRFGWEASGKAGIFANDSSQQQSVTDFPDFALRPTVTSSSTNVAYLGELNLTGLYQLSDAWNLRAGYSALWIDGLSLAPDQLDFDLAAASGGSQLHNGGAILLHGANVGVETQW